MKRKSVVAVSIKVPPQRDHRAGGARPALHFRGRSVIGHGLMTRRVPLASERHSVAGVTSVTCHIPPGTTTLLGCRAAILAVTISRVNHERYVRVLPRSSRTTHPAVRIASRYGAYRVPS